MKIHGSSSESPLLLGVSSGFPVQCKLYGALTSALHKLWLQPLWKPKTERSLAANSTGGALFLLIRSWLQVYRDQQPHLLFLHPGSGIGWTFNKYLANDYCPWRNRNEQRLCLRQNKHLLLSGNHVAAYESSQFDSSNSFDLSPPLFKIFLLMCLL